ncbi:oligosaccharide flippase family protein [Williamsia sp. M5A3_1d]
MLATKAVRFVRYATPQLVQLGLRSAGLLSSVLTVAVLARYLGPERYAVLATGFTCASILFALSDSGVYILGVKALTENGVSGQQARHIVYARLALLLPVAAVLFAVVFAVAELDDALIINTCILAAIPYAFTAFRAVPESRVEAVRVGLILVSQNVVWLGWVLGTAFLGLSTEVFAVGSVVACAVQAALAYLAARQAIQRHQADQEKCTSVRHAGLQRWSDLIRRGVPLFFSNGASTAYYRGHQLIVAAVFGGEIAASYLAAMRILDSAQVLPATVNSVAFPRIVAIQSDPFHRRRVVARYFWLITGAAIIVAILVQIFATPLCKLLLGSEFMSAPELLRILICAFVPICGAFILSSALVAQDRQRASAWVSIVGSLAGILTIWLFALLGSVQLVATTLIVIETAITAALGGLVFLSIKRVPESHTEAVKI